MNTCLPCYVFPLQFMKYSSAILPFKFIKPMTCAIVLHIAHPSESTLKYIFGHRGIISIVHNSLLIILYVAGRTEPQANSFPNQVNLSQPAQVNLFQTRSPCFNLDQFGQVENTGLKHSKHSLKITLSLMSASVNSYICFCTGKKNNL